MHNFCSHHDDINVVLRGHDKIIWNHVPLQFFCIQRVYTVDCSFCCVWGVGCCCGLLSTNNNYIHSTLIYSQVFCANYIYSYFRVTFAPVTSTHDLFGGWADWGAYWNNLLVCSLFFLYYFRITFPPVTSTHEVCTL